MCGRFYIDDETASEIEKLVRKLDENMNKGPETADLEFSAKDVRPTDEAPILISSQGAISYKWQRFGFQGYKGKQIIFNARSESVMEKPTFRESILHRRIVVPATWFYEWNRAKEKNVFYRKEYPVLFMAGCYSRYKDGDCFVILTTMANESMQPVHDRMPLILEREEITDWIMDSSKTEEILHKTPCFLERRTDYEQLSLF